VNQRWPVEHPGARRLGIAILALSLLRLPLPQADYHQIRHQHGSGEVCAYHDHLLKWHPDAGDDEAVAVLHWHWFVPSNGIDHQDENSASPVVHAHADGLEPQSIGGYLFQADGRGRLMAPPTSAAPPLELHLDASRACRGSPPAVPLSVSLRSEPSLSISPPLGLFARWNC
jgi:hypothetical protein